MSYNFKVISDDIRKQKIAKALAPRKKTFCEKLDGKSKDFFVLFLNTSSIHGLNHMTKVERHPFEIVFWICVVALALWGAVSLSNITWQRYQGSPTVVSMDRDMYAWNTTFPCVTVCPANKIDEQKLDAYVKRNKIKDEEAFRSFIKALSNATYINFDKIPPYPSIPSKDYMQLLLNLSNVFDPALTIGASGVSLFLQPTITEYGLCYSVNSQISVYNSPAYREANRWDIVPPNDTFFVHPLDGEIFAQIINLKTGYHVFLHGPLETPDYSSQHQTSADGLYMKLYVTALSIYTSPEAKSLSILQRKCRFTTESNLAHNSVYSYNLCRIECRISLCLKYCGCIPHFYRTKENEKVCDVEGLHCLMKYKDLISTLHIEEKNKEKKICECSPNCDDVNYIIQTMSLQQWFLGTNLQWGMVTYPKMRLRRDIIFGITDVLVSVGGMAGLFLGCSVLSFIEIIYFYTLRLFWYVYDNRTKQKNRVNNLRY